MEPQGFSFTYYHRHGTKQTMKATHHVYNVYMHLCSHMMCSLRSLMFALVQDPQVNKVRKNSFLTQIHYASHLRGKTQYGDSIKGGFVKVKWILKIAIKIGKVHLAEDPIIQNKNILSILQSQILYRNRKSTLKPHNFVKTKFGNLVLEFFFPHFFSMKEN